MEIGIVGDVIDAIHGKAGKDIQVQGLDKESLTKVYQDLGVNVPKGKEVQTLKQVYELTKLANQNVTGDEEFITTWNIVSDGDGITNDMDVCPTTPAGQAPA